VSNRDEVLRLLAEHGPMTRAEIQEEIGASMGYASQLLHRLHRRLGIIHIKAYRKTNTGYYRDRPIPLYALGAGKDAPKPPHKTASQSCHEYRERKRRKVASVFDLGMSLKVRAARDSRRRNSTELDGHHGLPPLPIHQDEGARDPC
jgi:hypothetical protein